MNTEEVETQSEETQRPEDPETLSGETLNSEDPETQRPGDAETRSGEVPVGNAVNSDELFNRLKGELMEEIRKYFEPIVKEAGKMPAQPVPVASVEKIEELNDEDDLIVKLLEETGWRNG